MCCAPLYPHCLPSNDRQLPRHYAHTAHKRAPALACLAARCHAFCCMLAAASTLHACHAGLRTPAVDLSGLHNARRFTHGPAACFHAFPAMPYPHLISHTSIHTPAACMDAMVWLNRILANLPTNTGFSILPTTASVSHFLFPLFCINITANIHPYVLRCRMRQPPHPNIPSTSNSWRRPWMPRLATVSLGQAAHNPYLWTVLQQCLLLY